MSNDAPWKAGDLRNYVFYRHARTRTWHAHRYKDGNLVLNAGRLLGPPPSVKATAACGHDPGERGYADAAHALASYAHLCRGCARMVA